MKNIDFIVLNEEEKCKLISDFFMNRLKDYILNSRIISIIDTKRNHYIINPQDLLKIGISSWDKKQNKAYISNFFIGRDFRNKGLGKEMIKFLLDDIIYEEYNEVYSHTKRDNIAMQKIFYSSNFIQDNNYKNSTYLCFQRRL